MWVRFSKVVSHIFVALLAVMRDVKVESIANFKAYIFLNF